MVAPTGGASPSTLNSFKYLLGGIPFFCKWSLSGLESFDSFTSPYAN